MASIDSKLDEDPIFLDKRVEIHGRHQVMWGHTGMKALWQFVVVFLAMVLIECRHGMKNSEAARRQSTEFLIATASTFEASSSQN